MVRKQIRRHSDTQGLGDWDETQHKLPHGIQKLVDEAAKRNIKFGIWIEPEMVSPKSELYEKHKDWVIHLPTAMSIISATRWYST